MELPVIIGKESNNDIHQVDLKNLPHLFVSYSEKDHINLFFKDVVSTFIQKGSENKLQLACALSREMYLELKGFLDDVKLFTLFIRNETSDPVNGSKYLFMQQLMKELKRRQNLKQSPGKSDVDKLYPLVVIIDDIFDIIITKRKYTGIYFLELLAAGKGLGIYFIAASIWTYRNLLSQLIKSKLDTKKSITSSLAEKSLHTIQPLIAELIITPEDLYFFKLSNQINYTRYFPIREGLNQPEK